jgi:23S rRNA (pseudouridine1915-N3)-methyltransferase
VKLVVRAVGKLRDRRLEELCREYTDRVRRHLPVEIVEVEDDAGLRRPAPGAEIVALDPRGDAWSTEDLVRYLERHMLAGTKALVFLIGGADGLSAETLATARRKLSLSKMVFPHRIARLVLCEQLYRAIAELRGEPYHRG